MSRRNQIHLLLFAMLLPACAQEPLRQATVIFPDEIPDDGKADATSPRIEVPSCASPLLRSIISATESVVPRGSVPAANYATSLNQADGDVLIEGREIFPAMRELIASAEHNVSFQTYVWEPGCEAANEILGGLVDLAARRAVEAPDAPPVAVRLLIDASRLGFGSHVSTLRRVWAAIDELHLDPRFVRFEVAGFYHLAFGNLHVKTVVVDGARAIVTGANPEAKHNGAGPWHDAGFRVSGEVAYAMLADFDSAWRKGKVWTCGADEDGEDCEGDPSINEYTIGPNLAEEDSCIPMLVVTRGADANPFSNRTDNTQDQAFIAAFAGATERIRIETPDLNDDAVKDAIVDAALRGVRVEIILSKNFNDSSENLPGQGGTNTENVAELYERLADEGDDDPCAHLFIRWYSYDGRFPVEGNGVRASHTKYASVDGSLAIIGTANMDTQSWNNSRELDVVVDNQGLTESWDSQLFVADFNRAIVVDECRGR